MLKKTLLSLCITLAFSSSVYSAEATVNDYDCTVDELKSYIGNKTEGLVQRRSTVPTFKEFVEKNTERTSPTTAGNPVEGGAEDECNYFWGDLEEVQFPENDDSGLIGAILSGDIAGILNQSKDRIIDVADTMANEIKKGLCKRLSTENVKSTIIDYGDGQLEKATGGYDSGDILDPDLNSMINGQLKSGYGNMGKLINLGDPKLDKQRSNAILKETDRQIESMMKF